MSNPNMNPNPQSGGQDDAQTSRYFDNPYAIRMAIHTVPANPIRTIPTANGSP